MTYSRSLLLGLTLLLTGAPVQPATKFVTKENHKLVRGGARFAGDVALNLRKALATSDVVDTLIEINGDLKPLIPFVNDALETAQELFNVVASARSVEQLRQRFTLASLGTKFLVKSFSCLELWGDYPGIPLMGRLVQDPTEEDFMALAEFNGMEHSIWHVYASVDEHPTPYDAHYAVAKMIAIADSSVAGDAGQVVSVLADRLFARAGVLHGWYLILSNLDFQEIAPELSIPKLSSSLEESARIMEAFDTQALKKMQKIFASRRRREQAAEKLVAKLIEKVRDVLKED